MSSLGYIGIKNDSSYNGTECINHCAMSLISNMDWKISSIKLSVMIYLGCSIIESQLDVQNLIFEFSYFGSWFRKPKENWKVDGYHYGSRDRP